MTASPDPAGLREAIEEALREPGVRGHGRRVLELALQRHDLLAATGDSEEPGRPWPAGLREAVKKYIAWQYRQRGATRFTLTDLRAALAAPDEPVAVDDLAWHGGMPLVPSWCIDHAETEVFYRGHHIPVAARLPEPVPEWNDGLYQEERQP